MCGRVEPVDHFTILQSLPSIMVMFICSSPHCGMVAINPCTSYLKEHNRIHGNGICSFTDPKTTIKATYLFTFMFTTRTTVIAIELVNVHE